MGIHWETWAAAVVVATALTTILTTVFRPFADKIWLATLTRNKLEVKSTLNGWYDTQAASRKLDDVERDVADLYRRFGELVEGQEREFNDVADSVRRSVVSNSELLRELTNKVDAVGNQVAHLYGLVRQEPWDGRTERRHGDRRI